MYCQIVDDCIDRSWHALVVGYAVIRGFIDGEGAPHGHPPAQERHDQPDLSDSYPALERAYAAACAGIHRLAGQPPAGGRAAWRGIGCEHRLPSRPSLPNGLVEHCNERISAILTIHPFDSATAGSTTTVLPRSFLGHKSPVKAMKNWYAKRPICSIESHAVRRGPTAR